MAVRVAINGFGRIGRAVLRRAIATGKIEVVAVNDLTDTKTLAHLFKYDSVMGTFPGSVSAADGHFLIDGQKVEVLSERDPGALDWASRGVQVVIESTGLFLSPAKAYQHIKGGAKKVILSAPSKKSTPEELAKFGYDKEDVDATFVLGVNDDLYDTAKHHIVSNASCTTNCLAPVAKVLHDNFKILSGLMTTIHAYTNDQRLLDLPHKDLRRARAAAMSMIPTTTGAARAVGLVIPDLKGKLDGGAIRVPTPNVSLVDLTANLDKATTADEIKAVMKAAAESGPMKGILRYVDEELVSIDFQGDAHSSAFDAPLTKMIGDKCVKIMSWYDNEWGYSCRVVDLAEKMGASL